MTTTRRLVPVMPLTTRLLVLQCAQPTPVSALSPGERRELHALRAYRAQAVQRALRMDALERATIRITDRIAAYLAQTARGNRAHLIATKTGGLLRY